MAIPGRQQQCLAPDRTDLQRKGLLSALFFCRPRLQRFLLQFCCGSAICCCSAQLFNSGTLYLGVYPGGAILEAACGIFCACGGQGQATRAHQWECWAGMARNAPAPPQGIICPHSCLAAIHSEKGCVRAEAGTRAINTCRLYSETFTVLSGRAMH